MILLYREMLRRVARRCTAPLVRRAIILAYHRIADLDCDPWAMSVTPRHFAEHLEVLRQSFRPLALQELVQAVDDGRLPKRAVVVTFDDGYADNLHQAKPLLERYNVPATFFVVTGAIGQGREFWWDELEKLLLQPGTLPQELQMTVGGTTHSWNLGASAVYSDSDARSHRQWRAWGDDAPTSRHALLRSLWDMLHAMPTDQRRKVLDALWEWACAEPLYRPTHRLLSLAEVVDLMQGERIEIGAHTVSHPSLSTTAVAMQREEIRHSRDFLKGVLDIQATSFSYPYGKRSHYTSETVGEVREAGFTCACSNFHGIVERTADPFQLPRVVVPDCDGRAFLRWLRRLHLGS